MPETFSLLFIPSALAMVMALLALAFKQLHPAPPEKRSRIGGFTWWLLIALCLGGAAQCHSMWQTSGTVPWTLLFWSGLFGIGAAGMWHTAHTPGEAPASAPAGLKSIGKPLAEKTSSEAKH
ncbi:MAG: hypothetical protein J6I40_08770 [Mailhella sp.]|nr:hypothetical protein [Mailhella sp.]